MQRGSVVKKTVNAVEVRADKAVDRLASKMVCTQATDAGQLYVQHTERSNEVSRSRPRRPMQTGVQTAQ